MKRVFGMLVCVLGLAGLGVAQNHLHKVEPVVQEGMWGELEAVAVSRDGKLAASASCMSLQIWTTHGELLRTVKPLRREDDECGTALSFGTNDRTLLATLGGERSYQTRKTIVLDMPSGRLIRTLPGFEVEANGARLVKRDRKIIRVFDSNRRAVGHFPAHPTESENETLDFSPDLKLVAAVANNWREGTGTLRVYNVASGKLQSTLHDPRGSFGRTSGVRGPVAWSPDGRILVSSGADPKETRDQYPGGVLKVWDWKHARLLHVGPSIGSDAKVVGFISARQVLAGDDIVNVESGKVERRLPFTSSPSVLSRDGKIRFEEATLRDTTTGKARVFFSRGSWSGGRALAFSPDGSRLAVGDEGGVLLFDARSGACLDSSRLPVSRLHWLDSKILTGDGLNGIVRWQVGDKLVPLERWKVKQQFGSDFIVSPDGTRVLTSHHEYRNGRVDKMYAVVEVREGKDHAIQREIHLDDDIEEGGYGAIVWLDDMHFARSNKGVALNIYNAQSGQLERTLQAPVGWKIYNVATLSGNGKTFAVACQTSDKQFAAGALLFHAGEDAPFLRVEKVAPPFSLSSDGTRFAAMRISRAVFVDTLTGHETPGQPFFDVSAAFGSQSVFSPDARFLVGHDGGALKWFDAQSGRALLSLRAFAHSTEGADEEPRTFSWLALSPDGFYDGSKDAEQWLRWRRDGTLLPAGALEKERRRPDLIRALLH